MFMTNAANRSPFQGFSGTPNFTRWMAIELTLPRPWLIVDFTQEDSSSSGPPIEIHRTLLVASNVGIDSIKDIEEKEGLRLHCVYLASPSHMNKTGYWQLNPLAAFWTGEEPNAPGHLSDVYETADGKMHLMSMLGTSIEEMRHLKLQRRFPITPHTHHKDDDETE